MKYVRPCLDCESKGTFQSYAGSINYIYSILLLKYSEAIGTHSAKVIESHVMSTPDF
jgi:hypothetical protein